MSSPLAPYVLTEISAVLPPTTSTASLEYSSDVASHLLTLSGPWKLRFDVRLPDCSSGLHFTNKSSTATVVVSHTLKVILRVDRGDDTLLDAKGNRKQFDIIVETPVHILSVSDHSCEPKVRSSSLHAVPKCSVEATQSGHISQHTPSCCLGTLHFEKTLAAIVMVLLEAHHTFRAIIVHQRQLHQCLGVGVLEHPIHIQQAPRGHHHRTRLPSCISGQKAPIIHTAPIMIHCHHLCKPLRPRRVPRMSWH